MVELEVELSCDTAGPRAARQALADWANGLEFVEDLSADWGVHEGSTHVWFELERRSARSVTAARARRARGRSPCGA